MKSFLTKIGKIYKTFKNNGLVGGGKLVSVYLRNFFRNLLPKREGDILIVTGGVGDSAFYRATSQKEEFFLHGLKCETTIVEDPFLSSYAEKFKIFIFHRTLYTKKIKRFIEQLKEKKREIIFDADDLVFDSELFHETDSYQKMNALEKKQYEKGVGEEIINDQYVKVCTASTSYLAKILGGYGKKVFVSRNKLTNHEVDVAENILKNFPKGEGNKIKIGYFSGTMSHNKDFATITDAIMKIMEKYPQADLYLAGYLGEEHILNKYKSRIIKLPFVPRDKYYENIWKVDINLAPLVMSDPFCESKSELKFFEPGILKIPTVAVRNRTFSEAITDRVDGFLAQDTSEWAEKIGELIEDKQLRKSMGEKAYEKVSRDYTNKNSQNEEYYNYLRSKI
jgi:O-antigen biosynthesis protein